MSEWSAKTNGLDLRRKILAVALVPTFLLVAAFLAVFAIQRSRVATRVATGMTELGEELLDRATRDLTTLCDSAHQEVSKQVPRSLAVAHDQLERLGRVTFSQEQVTWRARNQLTGYVAEVKLPKLLVGGQWAGQNSNPSEPTLLVDRIRDLVGADATLFQRINARGDMLRVATTVRDADGARAIGTFIPAVDPDGSPNPVIAPVLRGDTFLGRARVLDNWYLAAYEPIRDARGEVAGMLFIGQRQDSLEGIRAGVAATRIGETGTIYVLGGQGNQRGRFLIAPPGKNDGDSAWGAIDAHGRPYVQEIIQAALAAKGGAPVQVTYTQPRTDGAPPRQRLASVAYFAPWDWVVVAEIDRDETVQPFHQVEEALTRSVLVVLVVAAVLLLVTFLMARRGAQRIVAPLEGMALAAERIAQGDLRQDVTYQSGDEVGRLAAAFRGTIDYLHEVAQGAAAVARGDLSTPLVKRSDADELTQSFQAAQSELRRVAQEMHALSRAAVEGRLDARADAASFQGEFRKIIEGANATLGTLKSHLDAMPVPAMIVSPDFDIRYMNETGASLLGRSQKELIGTKCYAGFCMGDCRTPRCASARAMADDREVSSETEAHPEGLDLEVSYTSVPLHDGEGRVVGAFEVVSDQRVIKRGLRLAPEPSQGEPSAKPHKPS